MEPRQLAARGDARERARLLPRVGREEEGDLVHPGAPRLDRLAVELERAARAAAAFERHREAGARKPEVRELPLDGARQALTPAGARRREGERGLAIAGQRLRRPRRQLVGAAGVVLELRELRADLGPAGEDGGDVAAVALRQALDHRQAVLDRVETPGLGLEAAEPARERARDLR